MGRLPRKIRPYPPISKHDKDVACNIFLLFQDHDNLMPFYYGSPRDIVRLSNANIMDLRKELDNPIHQILSDILDFEVGDQPNLGGDLDVTGDLYQVIGTHFVACWWHSRSSSNVDRSSSNVNRSSSNVDRSSSNVDRSSSNVDRSSSIVDTLSQSSLVSYS